MPFQALVHHVDRLVDNGQQLLERCALRKKPVKSGKDFLRDNSYQVILESPVKGQTVSVIQQSLQIRLQTADAILMQFHRLTISSLIHSAASPFILRRIRNFHRPGLAMLQQRPVWVA